MREDYETLLRMCDDLLKMCGWPDYSGSDIKFQKVAALGALGRNKEAVEYCRKWIQKEPENIAASTAGVYAFIRTKEYEEAEKLAARFVPNPAECMEENEIMFTAVSKLYEMCIRDRGRPLRLRFRGKLRLPDRQLCPR